MDKKECYFVLGLEEGATLEEVKSAYRKLAKQYHPDRTDGDEFLVNMFRRIHSAYEQLTTGKKESRTSYSSQEGPAAVTLHPETEEWVTNHHRIIENISNSKSRLRYIQKKTSSQYLSFINVLKLVGIALVIAFFFYPNRYRNVSAKSEVKLEGTWVAIEEATLYGKPDIKTSSIVNIPIGKGLDSIGSTKYFYKVRLETEKGMREGYLLKDKIDKR